MTTSIDLLPDLAPIPEYLEVSGMRQYQREIVQAVHDGWQDEGCCRQLIVAATGTGKTVVMGAIAKGFVAADQKVLVLAHTDELITQAQDKFSRLTGLPTGREKARDRASLNDRVVVGSVQTMRGYSRLHSFKPDHFGLVMIDEAHRTIAKSYLTILAYFANARVVGVTATADRGDKKALGRFYERIAKEYGMLEGINDGWLARVEIQPISVKIDLNGVDSKRTGDGDVDLDATVVAHRIEPFLDDIAKEIWLHASRRRILGFTPSIDIAKKMVGICQKVGFTKVDWVAGEDPDRHRKVAAFKRGDIQLLFNAQVLIEGFDQDDIDAIVNLRATQVRALYQQIIGRGTRPLTSILPALNAAPDAAARREIIARSAKPYMIVLDPMWLHETHNLAEPASLVSRNDEEMKLMKGRQGDLLTIQAEASRDLLDHLREQLLKNANRRVARIDPFTFGVVVGDEELALYQPETLWDARAPTIEQLKALIDNGLEAESVKWRGQAQKILALIDHRRQRGFCSIRLMNWLNRIADSQRRKRDAGERISGEMAAWLGRLGDTATMTQVDATKHQRWLFARGLR